MEFSSPARPGRRGGGGGVAGVSLGRPGRLARSGRREGAGGEAGAGGERRTTSCRSRRGGFKPGKGRNFSIVLKR